MKNIAVKGGHYMKNKNIGRGGLVNSTWSAKKALMQKCAKKKRKKKYQTLKKFSSLVSLTRHFYKIHFSGAANRHAPVRYAKYVVFFFSFFFFLQAVIMIRTLYFIFIIFVKKI